MENQPAIIHDIELKEGDLDSDQISDDKTSHPLIGVMLAMGSAILVGISFIMQKKGLLSTESGKKVQGYNWEKQGTLGQFSYLLQRMWWCGMLSMAVGEVMNFVAYSVAPAILITPLGALRVIVTAILSDLFLDERLNVHGKIGVFLSFVGSVMIIIHAPHQEKVHTFEQVITHFTDTGFLAYSIILIGVTVFLIVHMGPKRGRTHIMVYISICNIVGALCVLCGKGLAIAIKELNVEGNKVLIHPLFWALFIGNFAGILIQIVYLNKSLAIFNTSMVTVIKYVFTNVFLIFGSILLFQEFAFMSGEDIAGMMCGFMTVVTGVALLNFFKEGMPLNFNTSKR